MFIYYKNFKDIAISFGTMPSDEDMVISVNDDTAIVTYGDQTFDFELGNLSITQKGNSIIVDFDSSDDSYDGLDLNVSTSANTVSIVKGGEVIAEFDENGEVDPEPGPEPPTPVDPDEEAAKQGKKCKANGEYFDSVKDAFMTAVSNTPLTITMIADEADSAGFGFFNADGDVNKDITIDLNGKSLNFTGPAVGSAKTETQALHLEKDNKLIIKNGSLSAHNSSGIKMFIQNYCDLTIDGVTIDCSDVAAISYVSSNNFGNCTIKDSTLTPASDKVGVDCWFGLSKVYDAGVSVTINNSSINGVIEYGAQKASLTREGNENWYEKAVLTINNSIIGKIVNSGAGTDEQHTIVVDGTPRGFDA